MRHKYCSSHVLNKGSIPGYMSNPASTNRDTQTSSPPQSLSSSADGYPQSSDEPAAGQGSAVEPAERRTGRDQSTRIDSRDVNVESKQPIVAQRKHRRKRKANSDLKGPPAKSYRRLLDRTLETTHSTAERAEHLPPSQIGSSYWSGAEKEAFFAAVVTRGPDDLHGLANAVVTKSQAEIRAYVLLLRDQSNLLDERNSSHLEIAADVPAVFEIVGHCEDVLARGANHLARYTFQEEVEAEQRKFGRRWLMDEAWAAEIESDLEVPRSSEQADSTSPGSTGNSADVPPSNATNQSIEEGEPSLSRAQSSPSGSIPPSTHANLDFLELFAPFNFLQLSRTVFMNGRGEDNWQTKDDTIDNEVATTPAIFLSAMDAFHSIAVDATRKLVQTTLIQASSRIRARDCDSSPDAVVTASDVKVATSLLEWPDWKTYWAKAPRRLSLDVHSEAKQYRDGRQTFKTGVQLMCHEIEAALGLRRAEDLQGLSKDQQQDSATGMNDPGTTSGVEDDSSSESLSDEVSDPEWDDPEPDEEHFLESLDMQASQAEAHRILDVLQRGRSPSTDQKTEVRKIHPPFPTRGVATKSVRASSERTDG